MFRYASFFLHHPNIVKHSSCFFSSSSSHHSKHSVNLTRKFLLKADDKRRRKWHDGGFTVSATVQGGSQKTGVKNTRRSKNLSKVFLDHITDIMSTGEVSDQLHGMGLELSKVRVLPDMLGINVYWMCSGTDADDHIEAVLERYAFPIRHELSQQRILGHVPPIKFVRDKRYNKLQEVEKLLSMADYGEDFEPSDPSHNFYVATLSKTLNKSIKEALCDMEDNIKDPFEEAFKKYTHGQVICTDFELEVLPADLPSMRHDVLGVDTGKIFNKLQQSTKHARADHRKGEEAEPLIMSPQLTTTDYGSSTTQNIREWAKKYREILNKKSKCRIADRKDLNALSVMSLERDNVQYLDFMEDMEELDYMEEMDFEYEDENQLQ